MCTPRAAEGLGSGRWVRVERPNSRGLEGRYVLCGWRSGVQGLRGIGVGDVLAPIPGLIHNSSPSLGGAQQRLPPRGPRQ